jgi:SAM-dependent methyltransferase
VVTSTSAWYEAHAEAFIATTADVDMTSLHEPFLALLAPGALILDVGCGSGRDSLAFLQRGFRVVALEPCEALASHAEARLGQPVRRLRVQQLDAAETFDGIWACASLLHVPADETPAVLSRLARALTPTGLLYASYKLGHGEREEAGRFFHDLTPERLRGLLADASLSIVSLWETGDARPGRSQRWVNVLARRDAARGG